MTYTLSFAHKVSYRQVRLTESDHRFYPVLEVRLIGPLGSDETIALVDTGATYSLFSGVRAQALGINIMSGPEITLGGIVGGSMTGRLHSLELEILGHKLTCEVVFSEPTPTVSREILGRHTVFDQSIFAFRDQHINLYYHPSP